MYIFLHAEILFEVLQYLILLSVLRPKQGSGFKFDYEVTTCLLIPLVIRGCFYFMAHVCLCIRCF